jgi:alpha-L-rhamnosidase
VNAGLLAACLLLFAPRLGAEYRVEAPRCERALEPMGFDTAAPRLSWRVASDERGQRQTAWQIQAASSPELLAKDAPDLWDSGRVESDDTTLLPYAGQALASSQVVHWRVRSWDRDGHPSAWSTPARWTMGLLEEKDWGAARWITAAGPERLENTLLRREFAVRPGLRRALAHVSGLGHYELFLNGAKAGADVLSPGWTDYADTVLYDTRDVTTLLRKGANAVGISLGNGMLHVERPEGRFAKFKGSFGPQRAILQLRLEYADGMAETLESNETWKTHPGPITFSSIYGGEDFDARRVPAGWNRPGFADAGWMPAALYAGEGGALRGMTRASEPVAPIETRAVGARRQIASGAEL